MIWQANFDPLQNPLKTPSKPPQNPLGKLFNIRRELNKIFIRDSAGDFVGCLWLHSRPLQFHEWPLHMSHSEEEWFWIFLARWVSENSFRLEAISSSYVVWNERPPSFSEEFESILVKEDFWKLPTARFPWNHLCKQLEHRLILRDVFIRKHEFILTPDRRPRFPSWWSARQTTFLPDSPNPSKYVEMDCLNVWKCLAASFEYPWIFVRP